MSPIHFEIVKEINQPFDGQNGYKITNGHFEIGRKLHSETYFFVKRYFQHKDNCDKIAQLLLESLQGRFDLQANITLIGFGNYCGLLLNLLCQKNENYNYAIVENSGDSFAFQAKPDLKEKVVIILPIACTCSIYFKLKKYLNNFIKEKQLPASVHEHFIVIFLIVDENVAQHLNESLQDIAGLANDKNTQDFYDSYGWEKASVHEIRFTIATAYSLVQLTSKLYLPEVCPNCFPELAGQTLDKEKYLFSTHAHYETPGLIFNIPNLVDKRVEGRSFKEVMSLGEKRENPHLFGNIVINDNTYLNFIRGNIFYENNKTSIIDYFKDKLALKLKDSDEVVFITSDTKHSSSFLEDIIKEPVLENKKVIILRYQPYHEFVDNFISIYSNLFTRNATIIYFEDVLSGGRTFKLISNYIKHLKTNQYNKTGFNLLLTLIDRTTDFTRSEILQKLSQAADIQDDFIYFFRLNVPVIGAAHLGDPLKEKHDTLKQVMGECHLDALKVLIGHDIQKSRPKTLSELEEISRTQNTRQYIPLKKSQRDAFEFYQHFFYRQKVHSTKLFLTHFINSELNQLNYGCQSIDLIENLLNKIKDPIDEIILDEQHETLKLNTHLRKPDFERRVVRNGILSVLSKPPFTYYEQIYHTVFDYVTSQLKKHDRADKNDVHRKMDANEFIQLKSLIKRSVELNSNYIISRQFLTGIKNDYWEVNIEKYTRKYKEEYDQLANDDVAYREALRSNLEYKYNHLVYYNYFLLYCFKLLLFRNPGRSIRLEELINSEDLLPENAIKRQSHGDDLQALKKLWSSPYYLFNRILKAENIYLINELKELHKAQIRNKKNRKDKKNIYGENPSLPSLRRNYFSQPKNDITINNARRLIEKSTSKGERLLDIQRSVCYMLTVMNILAHADEGKSGKADHESSKSKLNTEVRTILDAVLKILQPGIEKGKLNYAFFIEYREPQGDAYNLYPVISTDGKDYDYENFSIKLSNNGLIYNALYGLTETVDGINPQTLLFAGKLPDGSIHSFQENYYKGTEGSPEHAGSGMGSEYFNRSEAALKSSALSFEELYKNDYWNESTQTGLKMLKDSNMTLVFRLSDFVAPDKKGNEYQLKGQAVLVITNTSETTFDNFLNFMNIEKIRLLLLIKEELLEYLQKQFDNDAFMEVLENRKQVIYQRKLQHGLNRYLETHSKFFYDAIYNYKEKEIKKKRILFEIVKQAIKSQINFRYSFSTTDELSEYGCEDLLERMNYIFECPDLGNDNIPFEKVDCSGFHAGQKIMMHSSIPEIVIPELLVNMKKYSSRLVTNGLKIVYDNKGNRLIFENDIRLACQNVTDKKSFGGLEMCAWIMESLKYRNLIHGPNEQGNVYTTIINLNRKNNAHKSFDT